MLLPLLPLFILASCDMGSPIFNEEGEVIIERVETEDETFRVVRMVDNLDHPWAVAWLPDDRKIITERSGTMNLVENGEVKPLTGLPEIRASGQGGLLDVALHPDYEDNGWVYFTYSSPGDGGTGTALARARLDTTALTDLEVLYTQEPKRSAGRHYGSRIVFPGDGTVMFTIGDRGDRSPSQELDDPSGTTMRLNYDGSIPDDNPFVNTDGVLPEIYTYGHRNAQGMDLHPETGEVWQHEHGPRGGDELNLIKAGENYGWPEATFGTEYSDDSPIGVYPDEDDDIVAPLLHWSPTSIAPSGMAFYTGNRFPAWEGDIFVGALAQEHIRRVIMDGEEIVDEEELLRDDIGRIRDVRTGPDGYLYFLTDHSGGGLYRLEPLE